MKPWMHSMKTGLLTVWIVCAFVLGAHAQAPSVPADPALDAVRGQLQTLVTQVEANGQPTELLVEKMREGLAKRVPPPRIVQAVQVLAGRIDVADSLLQGAPAAPANTRSSAIRALVDALNAGLTQQELGSMLAAMGRARSDLRAVAEVAVTMAELAERGFARASIVRATIAAWSSGGLAAMPSVVALAARLGQSAPGRDQALESQVRELHAPPGLSRANSRSDNVGRADPGPPHDDGLAKGQERSRGKAKGRPQR